MPIPFQRHPETQPVSGSLIIELNKRLIWTTDTDFNKGTLGEDVEVSGTGSAAIIGPQSTPVPNTYLTWEFNETEGTTAADSSINGRNGTLITAEGNQPALWVAGKLNNAISNPGELEGSDYIEGGDIAGFEWNTPFSIECWFNQAPGYDVSIAGNYSISDNKGWWLGIQEGYLRFTLIGNETEYIQTYTDSQVTPSTYQHLVVTYDGTGLAAGIKFYLDGALLINTPFWDGLNEASIVPTTNNFRVGSVVGVGGWIGQIDSFSLYTTVLSQTDVDFKYNAGDGTEDPIETIPKYKTIAHYETNIFDSMFLDNEWKTFELSEVVPEGTTVEVKVRVSNSSSSMGEYGLPLTIGNSIGLAGQFIQFSVDFAGTASTRSSVDYIAVRYVAPNLYDVTP